MSKTGIAAPDGLVRLEKGQINAAALVMARAFHNDPIVAHIYPERKGDDPRLPYFSRSSLQIGVYTGGAFTTSPKLEGVAVWQRGEGVSMSIMDSLFSGAAWSMLHMGLGTLGRLTGFFKTMGERHNALVPQLHWYLMMLGVDPQYQGQGHAAQLLRAMYPVIDAEGLPIYLETETESNAAMYEHLGFRVLEEIVVPGTSLKMWLMLRKAQR